MKVDIHTIKPIKQTWYEKNVYNELCSITKGNEESVRKAMTGVLKQYFNDDIEFKTDLGGKHLNTDGYTTFELTDGEDEFPITLLLEAKADVNLESKFDRAKVMGQALHYVKNLRTSGKTVPNIIVLADKDEVYVTWAGHYYSYLDNPTYKWEVAPSKVFANNLADDSDAKLVEDLQDSKKLESLDGYYKLTKNFDINEFLAQIVAIATEDGQYATHKYLEIEEIKHLLEEEFLAKVISKRNKGVDNYSLVTVFMRLLLGDKEGSIVPNFKKGELLFLKDDKAPEKIKINVKFYERFINKLDSNYSADERKKVGSMFESLLAEEERRKRGDFYTPSIVVNTMFKYNEDALGKDWASVYTIWDMACGTKNMTMDIPRRYGIRGDNIYSSTLMEDELDISAEYNKNGTAFPFDFLNDGLGVNGSKDIIRKEEYYKLAIKDADEFYHQFKIPASLYIKLYNDEPILFFTNPPYGTSSNMFFTTTKKETLNKKGASASEVNKLMIAEKGHSQSVHNLYAQFYWRILKFIRDFELTKAKIGILSPTTHFTSVNYNKLLNMMMHVGGVSGFIFNANIFDGIKHSWGITYNIWGTKNKNLSIDMLDLADDVKILGVKNFKEIKKDLILNTWFEEDNPKRNLVTSEDLPVISSPFKGIETRQRGASYETPFGVFYSKGNNISTNPQFVQVFSLNYVESGNNKIINKENFDRILVGIAVRGSIMPEWYADKDEYMRVPSILENKQFLNDALVFSLFSWKSFQVSYRDFYIPYQDQTYDRVNEWFWHDANYMEDLFNREGFIEGMQDIESFAPELMTPNEPYVYQKLRDIGLNNLSKEAQAVLKYADDCLIESVKFRKEMVENEEYDVYALQAWDAGFAQLKKVNDLYKLPSYKLLQNAIKVLSKKLEKQVYDLGFLPKVEFFEEPIKLEI